MKTMRNEYRDLKKENDLIFFQRWQSTTATPSRKSSA